MACGAGIQNTSMVAQWNLCKKWRCSCTDCAERDDDSKILDKAASEAGFNVKYQDSDMRSYFFKDKPSEPGG